MRDGDDNPVSRLFRYGVQQRLLERFTAGMRVVDLACGDGEDALLLAARGVHVLGLDPDGARIDRARAAAKARGLTGWTQFECLSLADVGERGAWSGAYLGLAATRERDWSQEGALLAHCLRSGAAVLLCAPGRFPLPAVIERALRGRGARGVCPSPTTVIHALGPAFSWDAIRGFGILVPGPRHRGWIEDHPQTFGILAAVERLIRGWPLVAELGDTLVLEGQRR
jgi:SAM-dependent methyltransferase